jgi:hypothetical protein
MACAEFHKASETAAIEAELAFRGEALCRRRSYMQKQPNLSRRP